MADAAAVFVRRKIRKLKKEGKTQKQAVGQALGMARSKGLKVPAAPGAHKKRKLKRK